jgi:hypothetical protein
MSHFLCGRYGEACRAAYRSVQANPAHIIAYAQLAGRASQARAAERGRGSRNKGPGTAPDVSVQPPICGRQLCSSACGISWRCAAYRRIARVALGRALAMLFEMTWKAHYGDHLTRHRTTSRVCETRGQRCNSTACIARTASFEGTAPLAGHVASRPRQCSSCKPRSAGSPTGCDEAARPSSRKKAGRGWHHHSRALRRRSMGQGE